MARCIRFLRCLFCSLISPNWEKKVEEMRSNSSWLKFNVTLELTKAPRDVGTLRQFLPLFICCCFFCSSSTAAFIHWQRASRGSYISKGSCCFDTFSELHICMVHVLHWFVAQFMLCKMRTDRKKLAPVNWGDLSRGKRTLVSNQFYAYSLFFRYLYIWREKKTANSKKKRKKYVHVT